jgi:polyribonucleotide nucleotidyltransferase
LVQFGDTMVLAAVTVSDNQSPLPFFPLTVEYKERPTPRARSPAGSSSAKGARTITRSSRPHHRSLHPAALPGGLQERGPGLRLRHLRRPGERRRRARAARHLVRAERLAHSVQGPIAGVRVGRVQGHWVLNPTFQQLEFSDMELVVAGSKDSIVMVEGGALEVSKPTCSRRCRSRTRASASSIGHAGGAARQDDAAAQDGVDEGRAPERRQGAREGARRGPHHRSAQPEGQAHAHRGRRAQEEGAGRRAARRVPRQRQGHPHAARRRGVLRAAQSGARHEEARRRPQAVDEVRDISIDTSLLPRAHGSRSSRAARRRRSWWPRSAPPPTRSASIRSTSRETDEVVHAALQLPAVLHRRSAPDARHQPSRDRPRQSRRARAAGGAAAVRGVPVHHPHRLRRARVERLVVDGVGVRRLARAVRRRRADQGAPSPVWRWG